MSHHFDPFSIAGSIRLAVRSLCLLWMRSLSELRDNHQNNNCYQTEEEGASQPILVPTLVLFNVFDVSPSMLPSIPIPSITLEVNKKLADSVLCLSNEAISFDFLINNNNNMNILFPSVLRISGSRTFEYLKICGKKLYRLWSDMKHHQQQRKSENN
eukprot:PhM_4_TR10497/c0_g3_i1/m.88624